MGRPARPAAEKHAVRAAIEAGRGSMAQRTRRLAQAVARQTMLEIDGDGTSRVIGLLDALIGSPIPLLASDPAIDTAELIRVERCRRLEARGGRRLPEADWPTEDREELAIVSEQLFRRYQRHLCRFHP
jgi:hypothetical protein